MNRKIIETINIEKEIPQYKTWFKLHSDIIFVSVIYPENGKRKSYFRRKSKQKTNQNKKDNEMCQWHSDWQFSKIESKYGIEIHGERTYEISVKFNEEIHRIDSVVGNIAIEFQHTLGVPINEMDSRYIAHSSLGYTPYLILDFTEDLASKTIFKIPTFNHRKIEEYIRSYSKNETVCSFLKKIRKWLTSSYFRSSNLFFDFNDCIVRLVPKGINKYYEYERTFFIENLLQLEGILKENEEKEKELIAERKEEEKRKLQYYKKQERKDKILNNQKKVLESQDYYYYRKCLANKYIKEVISNTLEVPEYISFVLKQGDHLGYHRKIYIYRLYKNKQERPLLEIQYITMGSYKENEYLFLQSDIEVVKQIRDNNTGIRRMTLRQKPKQRLKLISIRNEVVKGYLHSFSNFALYLYDDNEKVLKKECYLFNHKVSESIHSEISDHFTSSGGFEVESSDAKKILDDIYTEDKYRLNLIGYVMQNYFPEEKLKDYYKDRDEQMPFEDDY